MFNLAPLKIYKQMKYIIVFFLLFQVFTAEAFAQQFKYHIVEKGETVYSIAEKYNISEEVIFQYNPDAVNGIHPKDKIVVPLVETDRQDNMQFIKHRVKKGETVWRLSQKYNVGIADIKKYNTHLFSEELREGEQVRIPINLQNPKTSEDKNPYNPLELSAVEHVVLPKETKSSISRKYNISVEELNTLNPGVGNILQPGMVLKVSSERVEANKDEKLFQYYLVKPQETIFSLTQRFGVSKDSLIVLNPALADGLKSGMVLKIPNQEALIPKLEYSEANIVNLENRISNYKTKNLVVFLPFNTQKITVTDSTNNKKELLKKDKVMQIALDFYSGVLMAVDSAKTLGIPSHVQVFDTQQSSAEVNNIIRSNNFRNIDAVIGPLLQAEAETAAAALQQENVPVISPLTKKETLYMPNFYQTRPTEEMLSQAMFSFLKENGRGKNIVIIADAGNWQKKSTLLQIFPNARIVNPKEGSYVNQRELSSALSKTNENWVILESDKINIISNATSYLNSLTDSFDITLFTTLKNNSFESDNVSNVHLSNLNFHFPSVDREYIDTENPFIQKYKKKYGLTPNTYAIRGFDVTYDILLRLASAENLEESMQLDGTTQYVENKFDYEKRPSGGYFNKAIYIMEYGEDLELNEVNNDIESNILRRFKD